MMTAGSFWNVAATVTTGRSCSTHLQGLKVVTHEEVHLPGEQQLQTVHLRTAHAHGHVETVLAIGAFGERLVEAAVLGLGVPVGTEHELLGRLRLCGTREHQHGQQSQQALHRIRAPIAAILAVDGDRVSATATRGGACSADAHARGARRACPAPGW